MIAGNTFDYPAIHGEAIAQSGYSYTSASHKAVAEGRISLGDYPIVDLIVGKQRTTTIGRGVSGYHYEAISDKLQEALSLYTAEGGNLLISGSYILDDLWHGPMSTDEDKEFAKNTLHSSFGGGMASRSGEVYAPSTKFSRKRLTLTFNTTPSEEVYSVESPEVVTPVGKKSYTILRYAHSDNSAAIAYNGPDNRTVHLGFPFETITDDEERAKLMTAILKFLSKN